MRKSTVASLRTRLREFENDNTGVLQEAELRFVNPRNEESEEQFEARKREWVDARSMRLRCNFLEDSLKFYQSELQYHVGEEKRDRRHFERDVVKEMETLDEINRQYHRQLRQSQVEVESMQDVTEELHRRAATHHERLLQRHKERSENQRRTLENENTSLRMRVSQLEAALANWKQMEESEAKSDANDASYKMTLVKEELKERNLEIKRMIGQQHKLEASLTQSREQLQLVLDFIDGCGSSAQRVELAVRQTSNEHNRLVNRLLNVSREDSDLGIASASADILSADGTDHNDGKQDGFAGGGASSSTGGSSTTDRAANDVIRLQRAVDKICERIREHHVELALAIDSAATVWESERRQLEIKHREALSHGQTLQTRIQVVERQAAVAQDEAMAERDRSLQLRDQAIVFLRARDVKEHRQPMRNVEVQTSRELLIDLEASMNDTGGGNTVGGGGGTGGGGATIG
jgi:phage tail tube protein FII